MVHEVYKQSACPLARVVHGLPTLWGLGFVTVYDERFCSEAKVAWSPCNKLIAVANGKVVQMYDAVALSHLYSFKFEPTPGLYHTVQYLSFSPDGCLLTQFCSEELCTWDLETGFSINIPFPKGLILCHHNFSSTYSMDGKVLAVLYLDIHSQKVFIATHDLSTKSTHLYPISEEHRIHQIWTHGKVLRFATMKPGCIIIWEVGINLTHIPEVVETFPLPSEILGVNRSILSFLFLPKLSQLAIALTDTLLVWNAQDSKLLLKTSLSHPDNISFSCNGSFFASTSGYGREVRVWKESPAGYTLHQRLVFGCQVKSAQLSSNGKSMFIVLSSIIRLWHTEDQIFYSSDQTSAEDKSRFVLGFSPSETLAAYAHHRENTVTILDLNSGNPKLTIDTGVDVVSIGVTGSTLVVVDEKRIETWALAMEDARANITNGVKITPGYLPEMFTSVYTSVSPDLTHVVILRVPMAILPNVLEIYEVSTGRRLAFTTFLIGVGGWGYGQMWGSWFTADGDEIRSGALHPTDEQNHFELGWQIIEDSESGLTSLQSLGETASPQGEVPWRSPHGHKVSDDGWILSPTEKRLLWLPHHWRSEKYFRIWSGRFLGLLRPQLPEVVILEFFD